MRRVASSLAALVSLLMVSASVSASACDLSCWLHQGHSDCHNPSSAATSKDADMSGMDMGGMDMGPNRTESLRATNAGLSAASGHSMTMSPQMGVATERFEQASEPETGRSPIPNNSETGSSCTQGACSQISASASPPGTSHSQPSSSYWTRVSVSGPVNHWVGFHRTLPRTTLPKTLAPAILATILRI